MGVYAKLDHDLWTTDRIDFSRVIWNSDIDTVSCLTDPRCVAKDHYVPPLNATDLSIGVPDEERGVIPIWALNVVDYVSVSLALPFPCLLSTDWAMTVGFETERNVE